MKQDTTIDQRINDIITNKETRDNLSFIGYFKNNKKKLLWIVFAAFLFAFAITSLLNKAGTIPTGLSSISVTMSLILPVIKPYLNFIYLGLNIPLFLIFWKKIKKEYVYSTMTFLVTNAIFGFLIGFDFVGNGRGSFDYVISQHVLIFCPPTNEREWAYAINNNYLNIASVRVEDYYKWLFENNVYSDEGEIAKQLERFKYTGETLAVQKGWPIFVYSASAVIIAGLAGAIAWKYGGSTGGTDIVAYYFSTKKKKSVGNILTIIGILLVGISLIVVWSISSFGPKSITNGINGFQTLIGLQTLASVIYIVLYGKILNVLYPKYGKVTIKIDTVNLESIKEYLTKSNFNHSYKIHTLISGYTGKEIYTIETVVLILEVDEFVKAIKEVDPRAWISISNVNKISGSFDYSKVE